MKSARLIAPGLLACLCGLAIHLSAAMAADPASVASDFRFGTLIDARSDDFGDSVAIDGSGGIYISGLTSSSDFPTTPGAYNASLRSGIYAAKLDAAGTKLQYATIVANSGSESDVAVDLQGNLYQIGVLPCSGPAPVTSGAYDTQCTGLSEFYVAKINPQGSSLVFGTYLGTSLAGYASHGMTIAVDASGFAYAASTDACGVHVFKLNQAGSSLVFQKCFGGSGDEAPAAIAVDQNGAVYVTGYTDSANFPTTAGAYDTSFNPGPTSAFLIKLNADGSTGFSTFVGNGEPYMGQTGEGVGVDATGNIYVSGESGVSGFVEKYNDSGTQRLYAIGVPWGQIRDMVVNAAGIAYLTGLSTNKAFTTTANAYDRSHNGGSDAIVLVLDAAGKTLYSSFVGGPGNEIAYGVTVDGEGGVYLTGYTESSNFPATARIATAAASAIKVFVVKLAPALPPPNPKYALYGTATDATSRPVCNVTVSGDGIGPVRTTVDGKYVIPDLDRGVYQIVASLAGYNVSPSPSQANLTSGDVQLNFSVSSLEPSAVSAAAELKFAATYTVGKPVQGTITIANRTYGQQAFLVLVTVSRAGQVISRESRSVTIPGCFASQSLPYTLGVLPAGEYQIEVELRSQAGTTEEIERSTFTVSTCASTVQTAKPLVVLVHGCCGGNGGSFGNWPQYLAQAGYPVYVIDKPEGKVKLWPPGTQVEPPDADACDPLAGYDTRLLPQDEMIETSATNLHYLIEDARRRANKAGEKVVLIAHSKGGLVSRAYIESAFYQDDVQRIIMLGTPNLGSPLAEVRKIGCVIRDIELCELTPEFLIEFNNLYAQRTHDVQYDLIAGDVPESSNDPLGYLIVGKDDVIVPVSSVHGLGPTFDNVTNFSRYNARHYSLQPDIFPTYMTRATFDDCILPLLAGEDAPRCSNSAALEVNPAAATGWAQVKSLDVQLGVGQREEYTVVLDGTGAGIFTLLWTHGAPSFHLIDPLGKNITPQTPQAGIYSTMPTADGFPATASYYLTTTMSGAWSLVVDNAGPETLSAAAAVLLQSPFSLQVPSAPSYPAGIAPVISATLAPGGIVLASVQITATVIGHDGPAYALALYDDGLHQDGGSGDGVYANMGGTLAAAGRYGAAFEATGRANGAAFERTGQALLTASAPSAVLTGRYYDFVQAGSGPGTYPSLVVMTEVRAAAAGDYAISAHIAGTEGVAASSQNGRLWLEAGLQYIPLTFRGVDLYRGHKDGPYVLDDIAVWQSTAQGLLATDYKSAAWATQAYSYRQFGPAPALFLPVLKR